MRNMAKQLIINLSVATKVIVEISHTTSAVNDYKKIIRLIDEYYYGIEEGFVFDYKARTWRKYQKDKGEITQQPSFCQSIGFDLDELLTKSGK